EGEEEFEEEEEFQEEEPQEEEKEDMEVDIGEEENEPELKFPYEEADPLNPPPPASDLEFEDVVEVEDKVNPENESVPESVYARGESSTVTFLRDDGDSLLPNFMRRDINSLFVEERVTALENLVREFGNDKERVECKKLKRDLEEEELSNIGVVFEERLSEAIDVLVEDENSPSSKLRGSPCDS
ncbi:hypothetical protein Tco_0042564, partial [Tanacetum coccineum]